MNKYRMSKKLVWLLRHQLDKIKHDSLGYVLYDDILLFLPNMTIDILKEIVETDIKNRFHLKNDKNHFYIRANQGHSTGNLDDDIMMEIIKEPIKGCYHGTYKDKVKSIMTTGLSRMNRKHIHIAESDDSISGKRKSADTKIYINMELAMEDGIEFYRSKNNVILTRGNSDGILLPKYLFL